MNAAHARACGQGCRKDYFVSVANSRWSIADFVHELSSESALLWRTTSDFSRHLTRLCGTASSHFCANFFRTTRGLHSFAAYGWTGSRCAYDAPHLHQTAREMNFAVTACNFEGYVGARIKIVVCGHWKREFSKCSSCRSFSSVQRASCSPLITCICNRSTP